MEDKYYDDIGIAVNRKREQLMKEAEEQRLHRHIAAMKNHGKVEKRTLPKKQLQYDFPPQAAHHPAPVH